MITLHFHLQPQYRYELFHIHFTTFLLVSSTVQSKQLLCFVQGQDQKSEQKHTTKNFDEFHNHSPLLTMMSMSLVPKA